MKTHVQVRNAALMLALLGVMLFAMSGRADASGKAAHPELSEQEMLTDCAECHKKATPALEKEWDDSLHGIAMIKCYQCHGTFESFAVEPTKEDCATCHADMLNKEPNTPCWECHVPHSFKAKK